MGDLVDGYLPTDEAYDEMYAAAGRPHEPCSALHESLQTLSHDDFAARCAARDRAFRDQGITFALSGEE